MTPKPTHEELKRTNLKTIAIVAVNLLILFASSTTPYAQSYDLGFKQPLDLGTLVFDFIQDKDGFFWFATGTGLIKYDGINKKIL